MTQKNEAKCNFTANIFAYREESEVNSITCRFDKEQIKLFGAVVIRVWKALAWCLGKHFSSWFWTKNSTQHTYQGRKIHFKGADHQITSARIEEWHVALFLSQHTLHILESLASRSEADTSIELTYRAKREYTKRSRERCFLCFFNCEALISRFNIYLMLAEG